MRGKIDAETIKIKPFAEKPGSIAAVKGVTGGRTKIPPPALALKFMEHAASRLLDCADLERVHAASYEETSELLCACWVTIATFTARRSIEIFDLKDDHEGEPGSAGGCLAGDDRSGWYLNIYIAKTLQANSWIPVPVIVVRAVELLRVISFDARKVSSSKYLFMRLASNGDVRRFHVTGSLDRFASAAGAIYEGSGKPPWHWAPHQFRRFFAIIYFYRFRGATLEVLSDYMRHFDIGMTRRYVTQDPDVAAILKDVRWGFTDDFALSITSGEQAISGAAGNRLKMMEKRLKMSWHDKIDVASPERLAANLAVVVERDGMFLTPMPWGTCTCPETAKATQKAACRAEGGSEPSELGADLSRARPSVCAGCPHSVMHTGDGSVVAQEIEHLRAVAKTPGCSETILGGLEAARLIHLEKVRDSDRYEVMVSDMSDSGPDAHSGAG
jgi:hypothetical protein